MVLIVLCCWKYFIEYNFDAPETNDMAADIYFFPNV